MAGGEAAWTSSRIHDRIVVVVGSVPLTQCHEWRATGRASLEHGYLATPSENRSLSFILRDNMFVSRDSVCHDPFFPLTGQLGGGADAPGGLQEGSPLGITFLRHRGLPGLAASIKPRPLSATTSSRPQFAHNPLLGTWVAITLLAGRSVWPAGVVVAVEVVVLDAFPNTVVIDVADDLLELGLGPELNREPADGAGGRVSGFDQARYCAASED